MHYKNSKKNLEEMGFNLVLSKNIVVASIFEYILPAQTASVGEIMLSSIYIGNGDDVSTSVCTSSETEHDVNIIIVTIKIQILFILTSQTITYNITQIV